MKPQVWFWQSRECSRCGGPRLHRWVGNVAWECDQCSKRTVPPLEVWPLYVLLAVAAVAAAAGAAWWWYQGG